MSIGSRTTRLLAVRGGPGPDDRTGRPAAAETTTFDDGADTTASLNDILRVGSTTAPGGDREDQVHRPPPALPGRAREHRHLPRHQPRRRGPEFRLGSGLNEGTDFQLVRMRNWKPRGNPKTCNHDLALQFRKDRLVFTVARRCIGTPATVRVGAKMIDQFDGSHPVHDWMKGPRRFTAPVASRLTRLSPRRPG